MDAILAASFSKNITETTGTSSNKISENDVVSGIESSEVSGETNTNGMSKSVETKNKKSGATPDTQVKQSPLSGIVQCNDSIVICGSDSDILLQAMILSTQFPNIAVLQSGLYKSEIIQICLNLNIYILCEQFYRKLIFDF